MYFCPFNNTNIIWMALKRGYIECSKNHKPLVYNYHIYYLLLLLFTTLHNERCGNNWRRHKSYLTTRPRWLNVGPPYFICYPLIYSDLLLRLNMYITNIQRSIKSSIGIFVVSYHFNEGSFWNLTERKIGNLDLSFLPNTHP